MQVIDRRTAKERGLKRYFTGESCPRGHICERYVGCGSCTECRNLSHSAYVTGNRAGLAKYKAEWSALNRDRLSEQTRQRLKIETADQRQRRLARYKARYEVNKEVESIRSRQYRAGNLKSVLVKSAANRAIRRGLAFSITEADFDIPEFCPDLPHIKLRCGIGRVCDGSPTLDRIDSRLGYVSGNVRVISYRANLLKSNSTISEMRLILAAMERLQPLIKVDESDADRQEGRSI